MDTSVPPPFSQAAAQAIAGLRAGPGPSPWYLEKVTFLSGAGLIRWQSAGAGKTVLPTRHGDALAAAGFNCYVRPLPEARMLVWHVEPRGEIADVRLRLFDVDALRPGDVAWVAGQLDSQPPF